MRFGPIPFPPVPLYATFGAKLNAYADFSVGFDTRGIAKTGNFLDGLYFGDLQNVTSGPDIPEFGISLEASVEPSSICLSLRRYRRWCASQPGLQLERPR